MYFSSLKLFFNVFISISEDKKFLTKITISILKNQIVFYYYYYYKTHFQQILHLRNLNKSIFILKVEKIG